MTRACSILALICGVAFSGCGGGGGKSNTTQPIGNTAPPGAAAPASGAGSAKKCYADPDDPDSNCGGIGTCLALCQGTHEACVADCRAQVCPEVPCPPGP